MFIPMYGFAFEFAWSEFREMTGLLPLEPTLIVLSAYTSCANKISVATELNSSPNACQSEDDGDGCPKLPLLFAIQ